MLTPCVMKMLIYVHFSPALVQDAPSLPLYKMLLILKVER
jgi:hypothetical protein